jgi:hypothetical protein
LQKPRLSVSLGRNGKGQEIVEPSEEGVEGGGMDLPSLRPKDEGGMKK